ncbi:hypothetical protein [Bacillus cihuensis]|uniref:hypothetical protein n=1 Tax=Bacillus cihuensis TaxID=1208599 RepID=UPI000411DF4A|nr:hypothetical protein [Bacillus cihuensis]
MEITFQLANGGTIKATIENYNAKSLAESLNDHRTQFIALGETGMHKNEIRLWYPTPTEPTA